MRAWGYDLLYRFGAPWEIGARSELIGLVETGRLSPAELPRAIDLGCGTGANAVFLAERGFDVTGVDFSPVALEKARRKAQEAGVLDRVRLMRGDLTDPDAAPSDATFDLLVDYGTLDDLRGRARLRMRDTIVRLSRPGSRFLLWCFFGAREEFPPVSFKGPSRLWARIDRGEELRLFGAHFEVERLPEPADGSLAACFLMTRR